jgi:hypothetical protein
MQDRPVKELQKLHVSFRLVKYKEVWIGLGGTHSAVYATEVSMQEYLAYTTEETEKMEVRELAEKLGGDMEAAIRQVAEQRLEEQTRQ